MPEDMPEDMPEHMPEDMPDIMPDKMPEDMSEYMPEDMPDRMKDRMPEDMSDRMPEDMPDRMPEDMPEHMPEDMPEHMPEDMPNRMPEDMSDRMPEDLPVRKCINVVVGITRSKVIFLSNLQYCILYWLCVPYITVVQVLPELAVEEHFIGFGAWQSEKKIAIPMLTVGDHLWHSHHASICFPLLCLKFGKIIRHQSNPKLIALCVGPPAHHLVSLPILHQHKILGRRHSHSFSAM